MITIKNVRTLNGKIENVTIEGTSSEIIDAEGKLTLLPALIDAHVNFCTPGFEKLEDWKSGAKAAIAGGVSTVFDLPDNIPPCVDLNHLHEKKQLIDNQLAEIKIPLRYQLYIGAEKEHFSEITQAKGQMIAIKVDMETGKEDFIAEDQTSLQRIFQIGAQNNIMIAVSSDVEYAILLAEQYSSQLYVLNVSTKEELNVIKKAKKRQLLVYAEATPQHLFTSSPDNKALWDAIQDGTFDSIGSNHTPCLPADKNLGSPEIETMLPLLLNAVNEGKLSLEQIVQLTRINIESIYNLERNKDVVLVDMNLEKKVCNENLKTKCGWSPYSGKSLKGWPIYTILQGQIHKIG